MLGGLIGMHISGRFLVEDIPSSYRFPNAMDSFVIHVADLHEFFARQSTFLKIFSTKIEANEYISVTGTGTNVMVYHFANLPRLSFSYGIH